MAELNQVKQGTQVDEEFNLGKTLIESIKRLLSIMLVLAIITVLLVSALSIEHLLKILILEIALLMYWIHLWRTR